MKKKAPETSSLLVTHDHEVDLSRAVYSTELSSASLDNETQSFHITIDKILYKHPVEVIETVLRVNGYSLNLENILACLDDFKIGATVQFGSKLASRDPTAKSFIHCVQFRLPQKSSVGPMLRRFYEEIETYESVIAELRADTPEATIYREREVETYREKEVETQKKLERLETENQALKAEILQLRSALSQAMQAEATATRALEAQNMLPPGIRLATVREINADERMIILKSGPTTINLPLMMCNVVPEKDDKCLLHINRNNTLATLFFDSKGVRIKPRLARVTLVQNSFCKIRDEERNTWKLEAKNETELDFFRRLKRNDYLLLYLLDNKPLRFEELQQPSVSDHADRVQEAIVRFQIGDTDKRITYKRLR